MLLLFDYIMVQYYLCELFSTLVEGGHYLKKNQHVYVFRFEIILYACAC